MNKNYLYFFFILCIFWFIIDIFKYVFVLSKEGFELSDESVNLFIKQQHLINPQIIFDTTKLKNQVNQHDLDYFLKNGIWYWSDKVKNLYKSASEHNPYIRTSPEDSLNYAQKIYNQNAIQQVLSLQQQQNKKI
jgi:hypothetical protein